jgi:hypothetical protein
VSLTIIKITNNIKHTLIHKSLNKQHADIKFRLLNQSQKFLFKLHQSTINVAKSQLTREAINLALDYTNINL